MAASRFMFSTPAAPPFPVPNKRYFMSFSYRKGAETGFSWVVYGTYNVLELTEAAGFIKQWGSYDSVSIMFFKPLTGDEH